MSDADAPKKYRNKHQVPRGFDCPTHGGVSLGGKSTIWLWPDDVQSQQVADLIARGDLVPWEDGEAAPEQRPVQKTTTERPAEPLRGMPAVTKVKTKDGVVEHTQPQPFGEVLKEGPEAHEEVVATHKPPEAATEQPKSGGAEPPPTGGPRKTRRQTE